MFFFVGWRLLLLHRRLFRTPNNKKIAIFCKKGEKKFQLLFFFFSFWSSGFGSGSGFIWNSRIRIRIWIRAWISDLNSDLDSNNPDPQHCGKMSPKGKNFTFEELFYLSGGLDTFPWAWTWTVVHPYNIPEPAASLPKILINNICRCQAVAILPSKKFKVY